ncbi:lycopene cyclase domain-containing protein [Salinibacterium sp. NSLL150]|uniref:lycopene cyclase domain-containing protein n=1 Tax=unclassified Salinibacterium TaxID=2632331 RepID=UPI0018CFCB69|nr:MULTISPECIES: lycopene cyclase domain-containing protein [unclassified Salinibacterium]MBH0097890.1 lycopene cyclase domain-containing protein [Salinibacterium sp. NSLL35]MBH0100645.1 lycopene cyclase domain-containing protein [Salinibacterium sp. NSLL150]MBH0103404.1 lycopene cyclase domain-containing protein [Salinibacterium sp. NSLL16]MBH0106165.1 lycopene cyclase domain-containing protein [Salinibacterium sp. NSLL17]
MIVLYLLALLISLTGMVVLDRRFSLFFWRDARRARIVLPVGVLFFLVWDLFGVGLGIFFRGETDFMTGLLVAPEVPLEEVFFLTLLCYLTMNAYGALSRQRPHPSVQSASVGSADTTEGRAS